MLVAAISQRSARNGARHGRSGGVSPWREHKCSRSSGNVHSRGPSLRSRTMSPDASLAALVHMAWMDPRVSHVQGGR